MTIKHLLVPNNFQKEIYQTNLYLYGLYYTFHNKPNYFHRYSELYDNIVLFIHPN